jgi:hypothetical protein
MEKPHVATTFGEAHRFSVSRQSIEKVSAMELRNETICLIQFSRIGLRSLKTQQEMTNLVSRFLVECGFIQ